MSDEEATEEYESVVIPIYQALLVGCLSDIMGDASPSELARAYGQLMVIIIIIFEIPLFMCVVLACLNRFKSAGGWGGGGGSHERVVSFDREMP